MDIKKEGINLTVDEQLNLLSKEKEIVETEQLKKSENYQKMMQQAVEYNLNHLLDEDESKSKKSR